MTNNPTQSPSPLICYTIYIMLSNGNKNATLIKCNRIIPIFAKQKFIHIFVTIKNRSMKKSIALFFAAFALSGAGFQAQAGDFLNHLGIGATAGTDAIGFQAAVPLGKHAGFRAAYVSGCNIGYDRSFHVDMDAKWDDNDISIHDDIAMRATLVTKDFRGILDLYPFKNAGFHLSLGVYCSLGSTRFLCVTEPNFGELYSGESGSDHRLYQEVALGFGGYQALKLVGLRPAVIQLNEVATFFAAVARLDELVSSGMDFYEAVVYTRKHTLYTNHTLVQAAEARFNYRQFEQYVFPNIKSVAVKRWLSDKFTNGSIQLSTPTVEIAELRSGVSKLHARVANYHDINGAKIKFKSVTNGIHMRTWVLPEIMDYYYEHEILDKFDLPPVETLSEKVEVMSAEDIRRLKLAGRRKLNEILSHLQKMPSCLISNVVLSITNAHGYRSITRTSSRRFSRSTMLTIFSPAASILATSACSRS